MINKPDREHKQTDIEESVRFQYEEFPYPPRRIDKESIRNVCTSPLENLDAICHYGFSGKMSSKHPVNILVAGGGTGDASSALGWQLQTRKIPGSVVYLDLSQASLDIAQASAEALKLNNMEFYRGSLLDIGSVAPGPYDYINCSGVLHHLESPPEGLRQLEAVLKPDGCMGIMLYATLGRTGVYHTQEMLRMISDGLSMQEQIKLARELLSGLPQSNWLVKNDEMKYHTGLSDEEIVDRFLHSCVRSYRVPDIIDLCRSCDLEILDFVPSLLLMPDIYIREPKLLTRINQLPRFDKYAFTELLCGGISKHSFFCCKKDGRKGHAPIQNNMNAIPVFTAADGKKLSESVKREGKLNVQIGTISLSIPVAWSELTYFLLAQVDGQRSVQELYELAGKAGVVSSAKEFVDAFFNAYNLLHTAGMLILRLPPDD